MSDEDTDIERRSVRKTARKQDTSPNLNHTEPITNPISNATATTSTTIAISTEGGQYPTQTIKFPIPQSATLAVKREVRQTRSKEAPFHEIRDPANGHVYMEIQYSNDPEDGWRRIEARQHPKLPRPLRTTYKFHPEFATKVIVSADRIGTTTTTSASWPDLD